MQLRWTESAAEDFYHIARRIREDNPKASFRVMRALYEGCSSLERFPRLGRNGRKPGTRELVIRDLPYVVIYRIKSDAVEIVRVYHGAQNR